MLVVLIAEPICLGAVVTVFLCRVYDCTSIKPYMGESNVKLHPSHSRTLCSGLQYCFVALWCRALFDIFLQIDKHPNLLRIR